MPPIKFTSNGIDATHERTRSKWVRLQSLQGGVIKREISLMPLTCKRRMLQGYYKQLDRDGFGAVLHWLASPPVVRLNPEKSSHVPVKGILIYA
ncbi:hypothetical protein FH972_024987 [Carpinus fangiana]|uniref:Uncharacterized protein n=1 Tax=Carpinus fangiana TaxID=176857 RepID=A0A5N6L0L5_9ROSI|nr:hypothetical protein FH972_024987 [Carpinus fangiana]